MEYWGTQLLEYWSIGVLEYWVTNYFHFDNHFFPVSITHYSIVPLLHYSNSLFHYSITPVLHYSIFLYSQNLAYKRNHSRSHNDTDNTRHDCRGCRISHCRSTPFTLHPP